MKVSVALLAAAAGTASAKTITVASGLTSSGQAGFAFSPDNIKADVGDIIEFAFYPANHSVAQSSLVTPCQPASQGGFFSGYHPIANGTAAQMFRVRVNDTNPIYFYCTQPTRTHCQAGMVGIINAPANVTVDALKKAAAAGAAVSAPVGIFGGQLVGSTGGNATSTSGPASSGAPTGSATTTGGAGGASATTGAPSATSSRAAADSVGVAMGGVLGALAIAAVGLF